MVKPVNASIPVKSVIPQLKTSIVPVKTAASLFDISFTLPSISVLMASLASNAALKLASGMVTLVANIWLLTNPHKARISMGIIFFIFIGALFIVLQLAHLLLVKC